MNAASTFDWSRIHPHHFKLRQVDMVLRATVQSSSCRPRQWRVCMNNSWITASLDQMVDHSGQHSTQQQNFPEKDFTVRHDDCYKRVAHGWDWRNSKHKEDWCSSPAVSASPPCPVECKQQHKCGSKCCDGPDWAERCKKYTTWNKDKWTDNVRSETDCTTFPWNAEAILNSWAETFGDIWWHFATCDTPGYKRAITIPGYVKVKVVSLSIRALGQADLGV